MAFKKIAFVFPGQGSQSIGMLAELNATYPYLCKTFNQASSVLGYDLWQLAQEGPEEKLNQTEYAQPVLLTAGVAVWRTWREQGGVEPQLFAGHSLGEYTALVCADSIDFNDALQLVYERGLLMQQAVPTGKGAMVAIVGLPNDKIVSICEDAAEGQILAAANYNSIGQTVVAGETSAAERALVLAKAAGAKIAKLLAVSVPSHCELMRGAAEKLANKLKMINIKPPTIPVIQNADVKAYSDPELIRGALVRQLYSPVRWVETIQSMAQQGVDAIIECGPGKVLTGLNKRINGTIVTGSLSSPQNFQELCQSSNFPI